MIATVCVVIVNWNSGKHLKACLTALARQSVFISRVIIIDNASSDSSLASAAVHLPDAAVIRLSVNSGFACANNLAIAQATDCGWIALLNPDAFPEPDWLENLLAATQAFPEYASFGCRMLMFDHPELIDGTGDVYHVSGLPWRHGHGCRAAQHSLASREIFSPCAAAALYRRDAFLKVGGFDEDFFCYLEDMDLGFRLRLAGYRCRYVPAAIVRHVGAATTGRNSDFYVYHGQRNLIWTYYKNMPTVLFWLYMPQHLALNLFSLVWFASLGQAKVVFDAKWDALKSIPRMRHKRRLIQSSRKIGACELRKMMATGMPKKFCCKEAG